MVNECYLFGGLIMDCYYAIDAFPERGQDGFITAEKMMAGGCAVNMAVTIENLGGKAHVISGMGDDPSSVNLMDYMKRHSLSTKFIEQVEGKVGKCLVFLEPDGERTFLTSKGAEGVFSQELSDRIKKEVPSVAGVTGYYLLNDDSERVLQTLEYLHFKGTKILFDPSPLVSSINDGQLGRMIRISDVMTPNTVELEYLNNFTSLSEYVVRGKTAVVKNGSEGGSVYSPDGSFTYKPAAVENVVDTTGAGDSFAGALLFSMMYDMPFDAAIELAAKCAGKTVETDGPHGFWSL